MKWKKVELRGARYPLPDGGEVEITDDTLVAIGDGFTFQTVVYRRDGVEVTFQVRDGVPGATRLTLTGGDRFIRPKDLAAIKLDDIRDDVYLVAGIGAFIPNGEFHYGDCDYELNQSTARKVLARAGSQRKMTPELLAKVAEIHNNAPKGTKTSAVVAAFRVNERTAFRYIAKAKQEGLIHHGDN